MRTVKPPMSLRKTLDIEGEKAVTVLSGLHDVSDTPGHSYSNYKFRAFI